MYGIRLDYEKYKEDEWYDTFEPYLDSAHEDIKHKDGICVLFDGMDGDYIFIGRVIAKTEKQQLFDGVLNLKEIELFETEQELIQGIIKALFGIEGEFHHYLIAHWR
jgi:hypothetical protein